jgi:hypothetical protein
MKQLTAVEWLIKQICGDHTEAWKEEIQQALIMEKEQIIDAYIEGYSALENLGDSEKYYKETYKKD